MGRIGDSAAETFSRAFNDGVRTRMGQTATQAAESFSRNLTEGIRSKSSMIDNVIVGVFQGIGQKVAQTLTGMVGGAFNVLASAAQSVFGTITRIISDTFNTIRGFAGESLRLAAEFDTMRKSLDFVSGSAQLGAQQFAFVRQEAQRLALPLQEAAVAYTRLSAAARGTALEGANTQAIFSAVGQASRVFGLTAEQTSGALLALEQMISKGNVSAEELRGQLGERIPGAFQIAARAMGMTTAELDKLLEQGLVPASEFLPRFAKQLEAETAGGLAGAMGTAAAKAVQLNNVIAETKVRFGEAIAPAFTSILDAVSTGLGQIQFDFGEINQLAVDFSNYLKANPQIVAQISAQVQDFVNGALSATVEGARRVWEWFQKNPQVISSITSALAQLAEGVLKGVADLAQQFAAHMERNPTAIQDMITGFDTFIGRIKSAFQEIKPLIDGLISAGNFLDRAGEFLTGGRSADWNNGGTGAGSNSVVAANRRNVGLANSTFFPQDIRNACAMGVRQGLKDAGIQLGVTQKAWDTGRASLGPAMANSFFGSDISDKVNPRDLQPGDLIAYDRNGDGVIDHVATYIGNNRAVGTSSSRGQIVEHDVNNSGYGRVLYGARPKAYGNAAAQEAGTITIPNNTITGLRTGGGSGGSNWDRYARRLAQLESEGDINARNPRSTARGAFQFLDSTRAEVVRKGGPDPYANNYETQAKAARFYISYRSPAALAAIDRGDFATADRLLNPAWTSLPGGREAATGPRLARGNQYLNNPPPNQRITTSSIPGPTSTTSTTPAAQSRYTPPVDPDAARKAQEKAEREAKQAADEARRQRERADSEKYQRQQQERRDRDALFAQQTERGRIGKSGVALQQFDLERSGLQKLTKLQDDLADLQAAQSIKVREGVKGGVDYAAAIKNTQQLIQGQKELNRLGVEQLTNEQKAANLKLRTDRLADMDKESKAAQASIEASRDQLEFDKERNPLKRELLQITQELANAEEEANTSIQARTEQIAQLMQLRSQKQAGTLDDPRDLTAEISHLTNLNSLEQEGLEIQRESVKLRAQEIEFLQQQEAFFIKQEYDNRQTNLLAELGNRSRAAMDAAHQAREEWSAQVSEQNAQMTEQWNKAHQLHFEISETIGGAVKNLFSDMISGTKSLGQTLLDFLGNLASQLSNLALNSIFGSAGGGGLIGSLFGLIGGKSPLGAIAPMMSSHAVFPTMGGFTGATLQLPAFGKGGFVDRPTLAIVGETQPELIIPESKLNGMNNNAAPSIIVNLTNNASGVSSQDMEKLSRMVSNAVETKLIEHHRPGGMFA